MHLHPGQKHDADSWKEAMALALTAQGRHDEATDYYNSLSSEKSESDRVRLRRFSAMCRFGPLNFGLAEIFGDMSLRNCMSYAATRGDLAILAYLYDNWGVEWEYSIRALIQSGHHQLLRIMHDHNGVDILRETSKRNIERAIEHGHLETISLLLSIGLQVGTADEDSPLLAALNNGQIAILNKMLEHDASWASSCTPNGELFIPIISRRWKDDSLYYPIVVSFLVEKANVNIDAIDIEGYAIIYYAVLYNIIPLLKAVLEENPNINLTDKEGHTALQLAIEADLPYAVTLLQPPE
ncbi:uncharacterized protein GIQ15_01949 [Arthroderma uncinatum]|uniref:uncharacterized protein n=1 Tax=Arthroderma uncinatum TaxID=74035 RepID=UPI00144A6738|nr:uncharacterized protein GIQ15_01949 [Arthroderma uncinatum]KAF3492432.1 hypothetical protein GIQ15_01949 [Arthroderma uncinatum]